MRPRKIHSASALWMLSLPETLTSDKLSRFLFIPSFTVHQGKPYQAINSLSWIEHWGANFVAVPALQQQIGGLTEPYGHICIIGPLWSSASQPKVIRPRRTSRTWISAA